MSIFFLGIMNILIFPKAYALIKFNVNPKWFFSIVNNRYLRYYTYFAMGNNDRMGIFHHYWPLKSLTLRNMNTLAESTHTLAIFFFFCTFPLNLIFLNFDMGNIHLTFCLLKIKVFRLALKASGNLEMKFC